MSLAMEAPCVRPFRPSLCSSLLSRASNFAGEAARLLLSAPVAAAAAAESAGGMGFRWRSIAPIAPIVPPPPPPAIPTFA